MEKWRHIWRSGFAPQLSLEGLRALATALRDDDSRLLQGTTCYPPALTELKDRPVQACCALSFCGWQGDGLNHVGEIDAFFQKLCDAVDLNFREPAACRFYLQWYDEAPRDEMRRELLPEVEMELKRREAKVA